MEIKTKKLTLIFITHDRQKETIDYLKKIVFRLPLDKLDIIFISDNLTDEKLPADLQEVVKFFDNENIGKLKSILLHCKHIQTKYFKIIDHDDCLDFDLIEKFIDEIKPDDDFIYHTASIINDDDKYFGVISEDLNTLSKLRDSGKDVN